MIELSRLFDQVHDIGAHSSRPCELVGLSQ